MCFPFTRKVEVCQSKNTVPTQFENFTILLHGVTANSLYLSFSPCKATNLTAWCHRKLSSLILFTMQSYKYYLKNTVAGEWFNTNTMHLEDSPGLTKLPRWIMNPEFWIIKNLPSI